MLVSISGCFGKSPVKTGLEGKLLPSFNLLLMDSTTLFNTNDIPEGKPIVLYFFDPDCPYCRAQTEEIITNMKSFMNVRFYIFSSFPFQQIKMYSDHYQLEFYSNIKIGRDSEFFFLNYFKATGVPYVAIYSKTKRLKQVLIGKTSITEIKKIVLE